MLTTMIKTLARGFGFDISRYRPDTHHDARYAHLLRTRDIRLILDVGANAGQYGSLLRSDFGYHGRILSFEPLTAAHAALTARAAADPLRLWEVAPRSALAVIAQHCVAPRLVHSHCSMHKRSINFRIHLMNRI